MAALPPDPELEFSFPIDVTQVPAAGRDYTLTAKDSERARVARRLDLLDLPALSARLTIVPMAGGAFQLSGRLAADVVQSCVVSLEPVTSAIAEDFVLMFSRAEPEAAGEVDLAAEDDPPEVLSGDVLDLGEAVVEQLALLIDPYPRAPGAVFQPPPSARPGVEKATVSPFAVLAKLKTDKKSK